MLWTRHMAFFMLDIANLHMTFFGSMSFRRILGFWFAAGASHNIEVYGNLMLG